MLYEGNACLAKPPPTPPVYKSPLSGVVALCCLAEGMGPAGLGIPWGRVEVSSITAEHSPTALQALPPLHLAGTQENLIMA